MTTTHTAAATDLPAYRLVDVEDGYARVANETGHTLGTVTREKAGSGRTSVRWYAHYSRVALGGADTRAGAVEIVVRRAAERRARLAAGR